MDGGLIQLYLNLFAMRLRSPFINQMKIGVFKPKGIKVFGWRWPSAMKDAAKIDALHFYTYPDSVAGSVWAAVKAA